MGKDILTEEITAGNLVIQNKKHVHEKFIHANVEMMASGCLPYYGEFNLFVNFVKALIGTCGVNITKDGMNFYWDEKFMEELNQKEANFVLLHEDFHLLFDHVRRSVGYDKKIANVVQDMIINQIIHDDIMGAASTRQFCEIPKDHTEFYKDQKGNSRKNPHFGKNTALFVPKEYTGEMIFENLYEWLREKQLKHKEKLVNGQTHCKKCGAPSTGNGDNSGGAKDKDAKSTSEKSNGGDGTCDGNCNGEGSYDSSGNPAHGKYGKNDVECASVDAILDGLDQGKSMTLDVHLEDGIPAEARKSVVEDFMNRLKNRGLGTADVEKVLGKLRKSKKNYLKEIKRACTNHLFGTSKTPTIMRPNRRDIEGLKGRKKYKEAANCILDVSGSMSGDFEKVLSFIFQNDVSINLVQVDTQVKSVSDIKTKRDFDRLTIKGGGGTTLQPAIDYIDDKSNRLYMYNTILLTDGWTDRLDFSNTKGKVLILTTSSKCKLKADNGKVKQIYIDREKSINE